MKVRSKNRNSFFHRVVKIFSLLKKEQRTRLSTRLIGALKGVLADSMVSRHAVTTNMGRQYELGPWAANGYHCAPATKGIAAGAGATSICWHAVAANKGLAAVGRVL